MDENNDATKIFDDILNKDIETRIIDVRSPSEFAKGHVLGAKNIPLLSDEERAEVGTLYKRVHPAKAFDRGLELVGPKMHSYIEFAREHIGEGSAYVYCWRGGKRSQSMSWLFNMAGFKTSAIPGGYKAYRKHISATLQNEKFRLLVLGGKTGSGKTVILKELQAKGEQIIDLEGRANHKGSAFGWIGEEDQPAVEHFENMLGHDLAKLDSSKIIWIENESRMIGKIPIQADFWNTIKDSPLVNIEIPTSARVAHLSNIYDSDNKEDLIAAFDKIKKRLGGLNLQVAKDEVRANNLGKAAEIALSYYDKSYTKLLDNSEADPIYRLNFAHGNFGQIADDLIKFRIDNIDNGAK